MSTQKNLGFIIALIGGMIALLAFFVMPFASAGFISATGVQIASQSGGLVLWILPGVAMAAILMAGMQVLRSQKNEIKQFAAKRVAAWCSIELVGLLLLILLGGVLYASANLNANNSTFNVSATSFLGFGFWIYIVGLIAVIVGDVVVLIRVSAPQQSLQPQQWAPVQSSPQSPSPQPWMQSQQWPPTQVTPPPQQWPPTQRPQSSPQWPPTEQQQPWQ